VLPHQETPYCEYEDGSVHCLPIPDFTILLDERFLDRSRHGVVGSGESRVVRGWCMTMVIADDSTNAVIDM